MILCTKEIVTDLPTDDYLSVPAYAQQQQSVPDSENVVTVKSGDTLYSLAKRYNTTVQEFCGTEIIFENTSANGCSV